MKTLLIDSKRFKRKGKLYKELGEVIEKLINDDKICVVYRDDEGVFVIEYDESDIDNNFAEFPIWTDAESIETHTNSWTAYNRLINALNDKKATKTDLYAAIEEAIGYLGGELDD